MTEPETYIEEPCRWCSKPIRKSPFADYPYVHQHDGASYCDGLLHRAEPNTIARQTYIEEQDMPSREELLKGAIRAQDERERLAGEKAGVHYDEYGCDWPDAIADEVVALKTELARISAYAKEAARTPITRESILADQPIDAPIPDDLKADYEKLKQQFCVITGVAYMERLYERIAHLEAQLQAKTQTALTLYDESVGLIRLILQPECCSKPLEDLGGGWMGHADGDCAARQVSEVKEGE